MKKATLFIMISAVLLSGCVTKPTQEEIDNIQTCYFEGNTFYCSIDETCGDGVCYPNIDSSCGISQSVCSDYETCQKGVCVCKANDAFCSGLCCATGCFDPMTDHAHCGACDHACKPGQACVDGKCSNVCPPNLASCESVDALECVSVASNWHHCGGCFQPCPLPDIHKNVVYTNCIRGKCVPECLYGWEDANGYISDGCESKVPAKCGNHIVEPGELCDGTRLNDYTCADVLGAGSTGSLRCAPDCLSFITDSCSQPDMCGNGILDPGELCDKTNFNGKTCASLVGEGSTGNLICAENCGKIDTILCTPAQTCGNGVLDANEVCDNSVPADVTCGSVVGFGSVGTIKCAANCAGYDVNTCSNASVCGNGIREAGESCDGSDFGQATCASLVGAGSTGQLSCNTRCEIDKSMCSAPSTCGNGMVDGNDICDGADLKGRTCASVVGTGSTGTLKCAPNCANYDISACSAPASCGNGIVETIEMCDGERLNDETCATIVGPGSTGTLKCHPTCSEFDTSGCSPLQLCGNQVIDAGEVCDGTLLNGKTCENMVGVGSVGTVSCSSDCTYINLSACSAATLCGNDKIDTAVGEVCDGSKLDGKTCTTILGREAEGTLKCGADCMFFDISDCKPKAYCGNGLIENQEICDLSNLAGRTCANTVGTGSVGTLRCNNTCTAVDTSGCSAPQTCGNGALEQHEVCDGSILNGQTCEQQVGPGSEGTPRCNETCTGYDNGTCTAAATCGDKKLDDGEDCDDIVFKNNITSCAAYAPSIYASGNLKCSNSCSIDTSECVKLQTATCGNGIIESGEACDGTQFGIRTCQTELGMSDAVGNLRCSNDCKSILTEDCEFCGDGKIDSAVTEDCDGNDWMVSSCVSYDPKTYSGGILKCDASTCRFDVSECTRIDASRECEESATQCTDDNGLELCDSGKWNVYDACSAQNPVCSTTAERCLPTAWCNIQHVTKNADGSIVGYSRIRQGSSWLLNNGEEILVAMICTSDLNIPVDQWKFSTFASLNTSCSDCGDNLEFMTADEPMTLPAGTHYCTFQYIFPDSNDYVCLPNKHGVSEPIHVIKNTTKLTETTSYIVN